MLLPFSGLSFALCSVTFGRPQEDLAERKKYIHHKSNKVKRDELGGQKKKKKERDRENDTDDTAAEVKLSRQLTQAGFPQNKRQDVCTSMCAFFYFDFYYR